VLFRSDKVRSGQQRPALSLSFGVVQIQPGESIDEAIHRADEALAEARRQGRNQLVRADDLEGRPVFSASRPLGLD
jgi:PleD family two-component response regulator